MSFTLSKSAFISFSLLSCNFEALDPAWNVEELHKWMLNCEDQNHHVSLVSQVTNFKPFFWVIVNHHKKHCWVDETSNSQFKSHRHVEHRVGAVFFLDGEVPNDSFEDSVDNHNWNRSKSWQSSESSLLSKVNRFSLFLKVLQVLHELLLNWIDGP